MFSKNIMKLIISETVDVKVKERPRTNKNLSSAPHQICEYWQLLNLILFYLPYQWNRIIWYLIHKSVFIIKLDYMHKAFKTVLSWDFTGGPEVKTLCFHCRKHRSLPWSGNLRSCKLHGVAKKKIAPRK